MKKPNILLIARISFLVLILFATVAVKAQIQPPPDGMRHQPPPMQQGQPNPDKRPNLMKLLNLTPEQVQQIRTINQEIREKLREATGRQQAARRALDLAIYSDNPNREEVERKIRELNEAQGETLRLRTDIEFRIRQILTPEQLNRFRELRRREAEMMREGKQGQQPRPFPKPQNRPL